MKCMENFTNIATKRGAHGWWYQGGSILNSIYCIMIELTNEVPNGWPPAPIATC